MISMEGLCSRCMQGANTWSSRCQWRLGPSHRPILGRTRTPGRRPPPQLAGATARGGEPGGPVAVGGPGAGGAG